MSCRCVLDYEDDEWPENLLGDSKLRMSSSYTSTGFLEGEPQRRGSSGRRRSDVILYNVAAMLACVGAGFDIRMSSMAVGSHALIASTSSLSHSHQRGASEQVTPVHLRQHGTSLHQPATANGAGESDFLRLNELALSPLPPPPLPPPSGQGTYHVTGSQPPLRHRRPSVNFDVLPVRFTESCYEDLLVQSSSSSIFADNPKTPSSDNRTTPSADSRTTPSVSGASYSIGSQSPRKTSVDDMNETDLVLISLSPSTDKAFVEYQKQLTDSGSVFESPWIATPKSTPQRHAVKFDDGIGQTSPPSAISGNSTQPQSHHSQHHRSPSTTSSCSVGPVGGSGQDGLTRYPSEAEAAEGLRCQASGIPSVIGPPPAHRSASQERQQIGGGGSAERPVTLDIIPRPRPHASILKRASPIHTASQPTTRGAPQATRGGPKVTSSSSISAETISNRSRDVESTASFHSAVAEVAEASASAVSPAGSYTTTTSSLFSFDQAKTLLDIDMDGQKADGTKPLPAKLLARELTVSELEREFLD